VLRAVARAADHQGEMSKLQLIVCVLAASACALVLSVGAALAETGGGAAHVTFKDGKPVPAHECFLHHIL
jgi:hypothetical protein